MDSLKTEKIRISRQADVFITKTATQTLTPTQVVERVMNFHFRDLIRALKTYGSVEMSGFGKFWLSQNKLHRKLKEDKRILGYMKKKLEDGKYTDIEAYQKRIAHLEEEIVYLETRKRVDETQLNRYLARMEESLNPPS